MHLRPQLASLSVLCLLALPGEAEAEPKFVLGLDASLGIGFDVDSHAGPAGRLRGGLSFGDNLRFGPELMLLAAHLVENTPVSVSAGLRLAWGRSVSGSVFGHAGVGTTFRHGTQLYWDAGGSVDFELVEHWSLGAATRICGLFWDGSKSAMWMEIGPALTFQW